MGEPPLDLLERDITIYKNTKSTR